MTISLETLYIILGIISILGAFYYSVKKTGAAEMKTNNKIEQLDGAVSVLKARIDTVELCGSKNDHDIGIIKTDLEWIKKGIEEIKGMLGNKRGGE